LDVADGMLPKPQELLRNLSDAINKAHNELGGKFSGIDSRSISMGIRTTRNP